MTFSTWEAIAAHLYKIRYLKYKTSNNLVVSHSELFTNQELRP